MEKHRIALWLIVFVFFAWLVFLLPGPDSAVTQNVATARQNSLRVATLNVLQNIECGYSEVGYTYYNPEDATERFLRAINIKTPLHEEEMAQLDTVQISYTAGKPTKSWQVALFPDNEDSEIRIYGYGNDTINPLFSEVARCDSEAKPANEEV